MRRGSFPRKRHLPLAALLGVAVAVLPAVASSETSPSISAYTEPGGYGYHSWRPSTATIGVGGGVQFSNPESVVPHGLKFMEGPATPSCTGIPVQATEASGATNWKGECTFSTPGIYHFICTVHPSEMHGTITVNPNGTTTPTTTTPTTTTPTTTPTTPVEPPRGSPLVGSPSLRSNQHGSSVRGSVQISKTGAGGRLEVDLLAKSASLAKAKRSTRVRVGRLVRSSLYAGSVSFAVPLTARGKAALRRHKRLTLTVKIVLTPLSGAAATVTKNVVLHA
jgi:plastocyanin